MSRGVAGRAYLWWVAQSGERLHVPRRARVEWGIYPRERESDVTETATKYPSWGLGGSRVRILVVDDDPISGNMVQFLLSQAGHCAEVVDNSRGALVMIEREPPDLLLLDVALPQQSGFDLYQHLAEQGYERPVIFVTGKNDLEDLVHGLSLGADDYIRKPFQPAELLARVEAVLRRYNRTQSQPLARTITAGRISIDTAKMRVTLPDRRSVDLTPHEMRILTRLAQEPGLPVSREALLAAIWGDDHIGSSNMIDVYVRRLRCKLERDPAHPTLITAARGVGYRFDG